MVTTRWCAETLGASGGCVLNFNSTTVTDCPHPVQNPIETFGLVSKTKSALGPPGSFQRGFREWGGQLQRPLLPDHKHDAAKL